MAEPLRRVGRYELLEVIGRGGAAVVYLAHQPDLDRQVALKELAAHHAADPSFAQRFVEESRLAASMNHPSIVTVFEYFEHDGLPYIAMEYMSQGSLRGHLPRLSGAQLGGVLESVLDGLSYAERMGIVHRDLKPENLLVGRNGEVKIADFGVARALSSTTTRPFATLAGTPIGTPAYMAPEQAMAKQPTAAADLYSVGIIAWEALAGRTPFGSSETPMAVLYQKVHEPIPPIETIRNDVHPGASRWLAKMLAKRPEDRYRSAVQAREDLEEVLIDMLGPRWRRDAVLTGLDESGVGIPTPTRADPFAGADRPQPRASAPALPDRGSDGHSEDPFQNQPDPEEDLRFGDDPPRPQIAAVLTPDPAGTPRPELTPFMPLTPLPGQQPVADDLHSFRTAAATATRRRRSRSRSHSRAVIAGAVIVLGVAVGGVIGASSGSAPAKTATTPPVTSTSAAQRNALVVRPVFSRLSRDSAGALKTFSAAKTEKSQATAALAVASTYTRDERALTGLPRAVQSKPGVAGAERVLTGLAIDWRHVSYDAKHNLPKLYTSVSTKIRAAEKALAGDALNAESGS